MKLTKEEMVGLFLAQSGLESMLRNIRWYQLPMKWFLKRELEKINKQIGDNYK